METLTRCKISSRSFSIEIRRAADLEELIGQLRAVDTLCKSLDDNWRKFELRRLRPDWPHDASSRLDYIIFLRKRPVEASQGRKISQTTSKIIPIPRYHLRRLVSSPKLKRLWSLTTSNHKVLSCLMACHPFLACLHCSKC
jgi:hypothetical protein